MTGPSEVHVLLVDRNGSGERPDLVEPLVDCLLGLRGVETANGRRRRRGERGCKVHVEY